MQASPEPIRIPELRRRLHDHVHRLAGLIGPRHFGVPSALEATIAYITREFADAGYDVTRQEYPADEHTGINLIVEIPGSHRADEIIVVGAHYDTVTTTPGADDNASAVAALLECARMLRNSRPRRTIRFVAFACEEPPHFYTETMGSQVYARACRARNDHIIGMLCLEMLGYYSTEPGSQRVPAELPRWLRPFLPRRGDFLAAVGNLRSWRLCWTFRRGFKRAIRFPLFSIALPELVTPIRLSDNSSFWDVGYRALMLTDTSFLRNPHYHEPTDTPETLDYERLTSATIGIAGAITHLARAGRVKTTGR